MVKVTVIGFDEEKDGVHELPPGTMLAELLMNTLGASPEEARRLLDLLTINGREQDRLGRRLEDGDQVVFVTSR